MEMVELYKVLADGTKILVVDDQYAYKYLGKEPIYKGDIYSVPVNLIVRRVHWMIPCIIDEELYIVCEVD